MSEVKRNDITEFLGVITTNYVQPLLLPVVYNNLVPDSLIRFGICRQLEMDLDASKKLTREQLMNHKIAFVNELKSMDIAIAQKEANEQHYEVPDEFYRMVLGPCLKYSSGYWPKKDTTIAESEICMLEMYCERSGLVDGMSIVDLGCGWGSVTLFVAAKYPNSKVTAISNSNSQREYIMSTAASRGLRNVNVFTGDIKTFDLPAEFHGQTDRVISIEMFEHMKNYKQLLHKISRWIKPGGKLFVHIFVGREYPYHFRDSWMAENFFTGGTLPSDDLLLYFQDDLRIENHWVVSGTHYQRTLEAWLAIMDSKKKQVLPLLEQTYGKGEATKWYVRWRLFFIACAEFFGMRDGQEYYVSHYLFVKPQ